MHKTPGAAAPQPRTFAVSADRAPAEQVVAPSAFDAAIAAIDSGAQRVEAERIAADEHYNELKNSGELERRRVEYAHRFDDPWSRV